MRKRANTTAVVVAVWPRVERKEVRGRGASFDVNPRRSWYTRKELSARKQRQQRTQKTHTTANYVPQRACWEGTGGTLSVHCRQRALANNMGDDPSMMTACTVLVGVGTVLLVLRYLVRSILGTNGRITLQGKHCLVTGGSSGIGKEVAKVGVQLFVTAVAVVMFRGS